MLDAHPELAVPPETHFIPRAVFARAESVEPAAARRRMLVSHPLWPDFGIDGGALARELEALAPFSLAAGLRAFYKLHAARFGKRGWGDKTPPYMLHMKTIERVLPEARFVHVIRDGRDVALSAMRTWWGPQSVSEAARWWSARVETACTDGAGVRHYLELRYETLVRDPETSLRRIASYLALPWSRSMLDYHSRAGERLAEIERDVSRNDGTRIVDARARVRSVARVREPLTAARIGTWKTEMSAEDLASFEAVAGATLERLGYPLSTGRLRKRPARRRLAAGGT